MILKSSLNCCIGCQYKKEVDFKISCLVFNSLNNLSRPYIQDLIDVIYKATRAKRSTASISLKTSILLNSFVGSAFS